MPPTAVAHQQSAAARLTGRHRPQRADATPPGPVEAEILRIVADPHTPVFVTVRSGGRRRYSYWRPLDPATGQGSCYVALPTEECDALHAAGWIILGEPLTDPSRTIHRVRAGRTPIAPVSALADRARPAYGTISAANGRSVARTRISA